MLQENCRNWVCAFLPFVGVADAGDNAAHRGKGGSKVALEEGFTGSILLPTI
jgi:hypothetical protein